MRLSGPNLVDLLTAISHYLKIVIPDVISQLFQSYFTVAVENYRLVELRLGISVELLKYLELSRSCVQSTLWIQMQHHPFSNNWMNT